jgi:MFS family permease
VALVVYQYRTRHPLMPVRAAATSVPVTGLLVALAARAAAIGLMELVLQALQKATSPGHTALVFLPEFAGALVVAGVFGALFRTRFTPVLAISGLLAITAAAGLFIAVLPSAGPAVAVGAGLLGLGVAASVSPALFMVGFSLRSRLLQRVFALIELMRGVTGFLIAPILLFLAGVMSRKPSSGLAGSLWICLAIAVIGFVGGLTVYWFGKRRLEAPDLERWQSEDAAAWMSPALFSRLRGVESDGDGTARAPEGSPEIR